MLLKKKKTSFLFIYSFIYFNFPEEVEMIWLWEVFPKRFALNTH